MNKNTIYLTDKDYNRLLQVVQAQRQKNGLFVVAALSQELKRAKVVSPTEIPADVITMNSRVRLKEMKSAAELDIDIVYPKDADVGKRKVSVLAPVGTAVLGCKVGDEVKWPVAQGMVTYKVQELIYQPEAAGDFNL
jgi:regulator of nucleoside diphosphate kinase